MLIAQLSDPHLRPQSQLYQNVVDSNARFAAAIAHLNEFDPRPDVVLLSGDLVDEGTPAEYETARKLLATLTIPLLAIPGNHDDRAGFRDSLHDLTYMPSTGPLSYTVGDRGPVRIVALDVTIPGLHHGEADETSLVWLEQVLAAEPDRPTIVMMHQPPVACGVPYLDLYLCRGGERLAAVVKRYPAIERIVCGHVHRFMELRFAGTVLCTAPSTTTTIGLQLKANAKPASFDEPPACLLHHWRPNTGLITHLSLIGKYPGPFPFA
jgi:3',5'-cyclic-AMP phosphodiesterase